MYPYEVQFGPKETLKYIESTIKVVYTYLYRTLLFIDTPKQNKTKKWKKEEELIST